MPDPNRPQRREKETSGTGMTVAGLGAAVLIIACCAAPALIAAGALAAIGGVLGNPWVIAAAIVIVVVAVVIVLRRRRAHRDACHAPADQPPPTRTGRRGEKGPAGDRR